MLRRLLHGLSWLLFLTQISTGCDSASEDPGFSSTSLPTPIPTTDKTSAMPEPGGSFASVPAGAKRIVLIMPRRNTYDMRVIEQSARSEAGRQRVVFDVRRPEPGDPPESQADLVRQATQQAASAVIVVADDPKSLAPALVEARDKGVAVVLLERPVPVEGKPFTLVSLPPYGEAARKIVAAAMEEAKNFSFPPEGPALILINGHPDSDSADRVKAFETALEEAGVSVLDRIVYGENKDIALPGDAAEAVAAAANAHPRIAIILADDDNGLSGAVSGRYGLRAKGEYAVGGFGNNPKSTNLVMLHLAAAVVNLNKTGEGRQAVRTALQLAGPDAKKVPERVPVETIVRTGPSTRMERTAPH